VVDEYDGGEVISCGGETATVGTGIFKSRKTEKENLDSRMFVVRRGGNSSRMGRKVLRGIVEMRLKKTKEGSQPRKWENKSVGEEITYKVGRGACKMLMVCCI